MPSRQLYLHIRDLLHVLHEEPENSVLVTLALLVTGLILGRNVQFWELALWVPSDIQLRSAVRRFERFVANPDVKVAALFEPFVLAMQASLSHETAYLILDCTQVGRQCRTLMAALAYHETVLPLGWQSIRGKKGHVTGAFQQALLERLQPYLSAYRHVIVLGDAEYCNESVITCSASSTGTSCVTCARVVWCTPATIRPGSPSPNGWIAAICMPVRCAIGSQSASPKIIAYRI